jgi:ABC-type nitrate/sulfonate/bicarbonate transport system substrate-binding protein
MLRVAIPDFVSNSYFPLIAAVELGCFRDEGLDASIELVFPVTRTYALLRSGEIDFAGGAAHATLSAFPRWEGAKLLAAQARYTYWFLVLRSDLGVQRGDVSAVRGLRIGAAPGPDLGLHRLLSEVGIDPVRDVQIGPVPGTTAGPGVSFGVTAAKALEEGLLDGFWANGMGAEVAVRRAMGSVVLDARRGEGPASLRGYTFPSLATTDARIQHDPDSAAGAVRALVRAQNALKDDPERATEIGRRVFPAMEAELIAELIRRDLPYYDPAISPESVSSMSRFAQDVGLLDREVPYEQVVATQFSHLWTT